MQLDHIAISATDLAEGTAAIEDALGVPLVPGGRHAAMGTHNRLLGLGPVYLEVIAIDAEAPPPDRPRWFGLDEFAGPPRLTTWIARTDDLDRTLLGAPDGAGRPMTLRRGDLVWRMAVPDNGHLPFDGLFPALIEWSGAAHPTQSLPDSGCRLVALHLTHPDAEALTAALGPLFDPLPVSVSAGPRAIAAEIETPAGRRTLAG